MTMTMTLTLDEERAARERARRLEKMHRARAAAVLEERRRRIRELVRESKRTHPACSCRIPASITDAELLELGAGCTGTWVCPVLDRVRRELGR
jgi:hypothetical protein